MAENVSQFRLSNACAEPSGFHPIAVEDQAGAVLGAGGPLRPSAEQRLLLELAQSFVALPRWQQEAFLKLVRALAAAGTDAGPGKERTTTGQTEAQP